MDCSQKHEPEEPFFLRDAIVGEIARLYCTSVSAVEADISSRPIAKEQLEQFCEAMEDAGYHLIIAHDAAQSSQKKSGFGALGKGSPSGFVRLMFHFTGGPGQAGSRNN